MNNPVDPVSSFAQRHIGPTPHEQATMLSVLGVGSLDELVDQVVPAGIRHGRPLSLPDPLSETQALAKLRALAGQNQIFRSYIGQGYYGTFTPAVIQRNVLENPAWYTAYTPYQPEISQGRLQALLNFQTMVADLCGMDLANASLLDEATAAAEAMGVAWRQSDGENRRFFASRHCHPQTLAVLATHAEAQGIELSIGDEADGLPECFGVLLQYPHSLGGVVDYTDLVARAHQTGALVAVAADLLALVVLKSPGQWGADLVVGSSQRFGIPMAYGGPHAAFMACRESLRRHLPGRLVGVSVDSQGQPALRLALQTREQHIRREKATSNICTAQVLLAVMAGMYALWHGPEGLRVIARRVEGLTSVARDALTRMGWHIVNVTSFDTLHVASGPQTNALVSRAQARKINLRRVSAESVAFSLDETVGLSDLRDLLGVFADGCGRAGQAARIVDDVLASVDLSSLSGAQAAQALPAGLRRDTPILIHPVFSSIRSETDMLRYLRMLADKDLALDRTMIPLGSCTMKLNATTEMLPITWPEFSGLHPFVPAEQAEGYRRLIGQLSVWLCEITGYDAISLQPNSGAQGEYAGLLAIRAWHRSRGDHQRTVCLIPSSAHGTNPASAYRAGFEVRVVAADAHGSVDLDDLKGKVAEAGDRLAAIMITYPSTHGVFEERVVELCDIVHQAGGQVYLDGANMNAMVGIARPGWFGADVSHLNLHKTFCIPHGGGGPGVGPVAVKAHLAPWLPGEAGARGPGLANAPVSAAPYGSAGILPISWVYIALMGAPGLLDASRVAILSANYIAVRLRDHYPVLYTGQGGWVAHECIIDLRPFKETAGIQVDDVAKRLIDYGFHAPTMSFPVPGTLMIEPTESEGLAELDRFIDALVAIRGEIARIESGEWGRESNVLKNAPHTAQMLLSDQWSAPYSRELAAYPVVSLKQSKYWSPVARVDNVWGDRHLFCACPPWSDDTAS